MQQGIDSRAMLTVFLARLPRLFLLAVAGAVLGSGLYLLAALDASGNACFVSETEYYIEFEEGRYKARDYYNALHGMKRSGEMKSLAGRWSCWEAAMTGTM